MFFAFRTFQTRLKKSAKLPSKIETMQRSLDIREHEIAVHGPLLMVFNIMIKDF